jgi:predicted DNA-binding transcriptional regulator AlpA
LQRAAQRTPNQPEEKVSTFSRSQHRFRSDVEIEHIYGISRKSLRTWRLLGKGPIYRKFGRAVKYDLLDVEAWIESLPSGGAGVPSSAVK